MKKVAFTVIAQNYVALAATLNKSMRDSNPETEFIIILVDGVPSEISEYAKKYNLNIKSAIDFMDKEKFQKMAFYYEITEFCTSIKPFIMHKLIEHANIVTYIDPDIYVYQNFENNIYNELINHDILLTPHICEPIHDAYLPNEDVHLKSGTYNLGFISVKNSESTLKFLNWWKSKCETECFNESCRGLFVDQKWINLVPGMFENVKVSRYLGFNMAYWNLHNRSLKNGLVNNKFPLVFFHFSGLVLHDIENISKYQNRFSLKVRPDLAPLFVDYKAMLLSFKDPEIENINYQFNYYSNKKEITLLERRIFFWNFDKFKSPFESPESEKEVLEFFKGIRIRSVEKKSNNMDIHTINKKAKVINKILKIVFFR